MRSLLRFVFVLLLLASPRIRGGDDPRPDREAIESALCERQSWLHNRIGLSESVPPPWIPLRVEPEGTGIVRLQTLMQRYEFRDTLFPVTMNAGQTPLLAGPIRLLVGTGPASAVAAERLSQTCRTPAEAEILAEGRTPSLDIVVRHRAEYDGMLWSTLRLTPRGETARLEALTLAIPLRGEIAKYINHNHFYGERNTASNTMGKMEPLPFRMAFKPSVWLGDERRGLCWFAESDRGWDRSPPEEEQIELAEEGDARILRIRFYRTPRTISGTVEFSFGLLVTPTKPLPDDWRTHRALFFAPHFLDWKWDRGDYYPEPDPAKAASGATAAMAARPEAYFKTSFNYFAIRLRDGTRAADTWLCSREWECRTPAAETARSASPPPPDPDVGTSRGSPLSSQADWLLWKWNRLIETYNIRNVYFDSLGGPDANRLHGAGYVDEDGTLRPTYNLLAMRRALQRFYTMMAEHHGADFHIMIHGGSSVPPVLSFAHAHLSGEQFIIDPRRVQAHYTEVTPFEEWRGYFMGKPQGVVGVFLPELPLRRRQYTAPTREMLMLALLHDTAVVPAYSHGGTIRQVDEALQTFGMEHLRHFPYWENGEAVTVSDPRVKVSLYARTDGRKECLLVAGNPTSEHRRCDIEIRIPALDAEKASARDLLYDETFALREGRFSLAVKALDFRLIAVGDPRP